LVVVELLLISAMSRSSDGEGGAGGTKKARLWALAEICGTCASRSACAIQDGSANHTSSGADRPPGLDDPNASFMTAQRTEKRRCPQHSASRPIVGHFRATGATFPHPTSATNSADQQKLHDHQSYFYRGNLAIMMRDQESESAMPTATVERPYARHSAAIVVAVMRCQRIDRGK